MFVIGSPGRGYVGVLTGSSFDSIRREIDKKVLSIMNLCSHHGYMSQAVIESDTKSGRSSKGSIQLRTSADGSHDREVHATSGGHQC